ncbi:DinB family protein [Desertihabitans aurantiacus]|uniref:DinB family protein n=1 Tax=Desertihabitans aurantiacus TaxID=2282477 RepID=UPI0018E57A3B|nr:DinB family protein [Desertihabitans aurantiacus]
MPTSRPDLPPRRFGWEDMFVPPEADPRPQEVGSPTERAVLTSYLHNYRLTLELKCSGLDAAQLATRSVPPSDLSLLGLVRHLAGVERIWFRRRMAGADVPPLYRTDDARDDDFAGAEPRAAVVTEAWRTWRAEVAFAERLVASTEDLGWRGPHGDVLREVLVHVIEEYARHMGHADLLRERVDGRVGQ